MKAKIIDVKVSCAQDGCEYFDCFYVASEGKKFYLDIYDSDFYDQTTEDMSADEKIEWAKAQVGKHIFTRNVRAATYKTSGHVYIVEE